MQFYCADKTELKPEIAVLIMYGQEERSAMPMSEFVNNTRSAK